MQPEKQVGTIFRLPTQSHQRQPENLCHTHWKYFGDIMLRADPPPTATNFKKGSLNNITDDCRLGTWQTSTAVTTTDTPKKQACCCMA